MNRVLLALLLLCLTLRAFATAQCNAIPKNDIWLGADRVKITRERGDMQITRNGDVYYHQRQIALDAAGRQLALAYQTALRRDLPWIERSAHQQLQESYQQLKKTVEANLGKESNTQRRLDWLNTQLNQQLNRIITHHVEGLMFHHQAIGEATREGETIVQRALGGLLQDSLNDAGKQVASDGNPLHAMLSNLTGLQSALQTQWQSQARQWQALGQQVCQRLQALDKQYSALVKVVDAK